MQRVLDLDLDFFVQPVVFDVPPDGQRPSSTDHDVTLDPDTTLSSIDVDRVDGLEAAMVYLRERTRLNQPVPGAAVRHHDEVFDWWRDLIDDGVLCPPFHVTHVDAHADF